MESILEKSGTSSAEPEPCILPWAPDEAEMTALLACKILIVDDEKSNVQLLERVLTRAGFDNFISTTDSSEVGALFVDFQPDLVLTDWFMPEVDGCAVIRQVRSLVGTPDYLPIVVLTADVTTETRQRALSEGATDFLTKPFDQIEVHLRIQNLLRTRLAHLTIQSQNATLEGHVRQRTIDLERALAELRRTQHQVIQQERLAALGTMAGGIAHDFNNALSIIMGFGEVLLRNLEDGLTKENAEEPVTTILTAAEDAAKIVHRLTDFYRPQASEELRRPVDLNSLVEQAVALTLPRWQTNARAGGRTISVTKELGDIQAIAGDAAELREALTNLIFNAVDALPEGGNITLATYPDGGKTVLRITDTGTGMSEEVRQRCLEPFFTTKGACGTGLGLSMVFGIIQRHGGTIEIESELSKGTAFILHLPNAESADSAAPDAAQWSGEPLRILVVDDQPILTHLVCQYLEDDLHFVEAAHNGSEALEIFRTGTFDLVITDLVMAEMTGERLSQMVKKLSPTTPVILLSGYAGDTDAEDHPAPSVDLILAKPLSRAALRNALATMMER